MMSTRTIPEGNLNNTIYGEREREREIFIFHFGTCRHITFSKATPILPHNRQPLDTADQIVAHCGISIIKIEFSFTFTFCHLRRGY
jgi:hypothetical protein